MRAGLIVVLVASLLGSAMAFPASTTSGVASSPAPSHSATVARSSGGPRGRFAASQVRDTASGTCGGSSTACQSGNWLTLNLGTGFGDLIFVVVTTYAQSANAIALSASEISDTAGSTWHAVTTSAPTDISMNFTLLWALVNASVTSDAIHITANSGSLLALEANVVAVDVENVEIFNGESGPLDGAVQTAYSITNVYQSLSSTHTPTVPGDVLYSFAGADSSFVQTSGTQVVSLNTNQTLAWIGSQSVSGTAPATATVAGLPYPTYPLFFASVLVRSQLTAGTPSPNSFSLDAGQAVTLTANPYGGTAPYTILWWTGGTSAGLCSSEVTEVGTGSTLTITSSVSDTPGTYYYCTSVQDGAGVFANPTTTASVMLSAPLTASSTPQATPTLVDQNQSLQLTSILPSSGTAPLAWVWQVSLNGGAYSTASLCSTSSGSGASYGATETCSISASSWPSSGSYSFRLNTSDSSGAGAESATSASVTVNVGSTPTPSTVPIASATRIDADQLLWLNATLPTTGTSPYFYQWMASTNGGPFALTSCSGASGNGAGGAVESCAFPANALSSGTYQFTLQTTDQAGAVQTSRPSTTVQVSPALTRPSAPSTTVRSVDVSQPLDVAGSLPAAGTAPLSWQWWMSTNGSALEIAPCGTGNGTNGTPGSSEFCVVPAGALAPGTNYAFALQVNDSANRSESFTSPLSATVSVYSSLQPSGAPQVSAPRVDIGQSSNITARLPTTGAAPYTWQWFYAAEGGGGYLPATGPECLEPSGTGGAAGAVVTCSFSPSSSTPLGNYSFELLVSDSANASSTSNASVFVQVASRLAAPPAPTVGVSTLDANQPLTVNATLPRSGTAPYSWRWLVRENGVGASTTAPCSSPAGSGGGPGSNVTCQIPSSALVGGNNYTFLLAVNDSATLSASNVSLASLPVEVFAALIAPSAPIATNRSLDVGQASTLSATLPTSGTAPYSWAWGYSTNGGASFQPATASVCATPNGTLGTPGAAVSCLFTTNGTTPLATYLFELAVTDSASVPLTVTSASTSITVSGPLVAGAVVPPATYLGFGSSMRLNATATGGTSPYSYQWYSSASGSGTCTSGSPIAGATGGSYLATPGVSTYYCYTVTDHSAVSESAASGWVSLTVLYRVTIAESGLPAGLAWQASLTGPSGGNFTGHLTVNATGSVLDFWVPAGTFGYRIADVPGWHITSPSGGGYAGTVAISTGNATTSVTFQATTYAVTFSETGLPSGRSWLVSTADGPQASSSGTIVVDLPNGTSSYQVPAVGAWTVLVPSEASGAVVVRGLPVTVAITFSYTIPVTFTQNIVSNGTAWTLYVNATNNASAALGTTQSGPTSWVVTSSGLTATLDLPNGTYVYTFTSPGHAPTNGTFPVSGQPANLSVGASGSPSTLPWWIWAVIGIAIVVLALAGVVLWRGRRKGSAPETTASTK